MLADGCTIGEGTVIENSLVGLRCDIGKNVTIRNCILMGRDQYHGKDESCCDGKPGHGIGEGSRIEGAIIDKNCFIGRNVQIVNESGIEYRDVDEQVVIRDGIVVVTKGSEIADGWQLPQ